MLIETVCGRLFVETFGEGRDIVLWPSLLCDGGMWRPQIDALADRCRLINVDPPGHGRSAPTRRAYTMDDCVTAAVQVMDAVGISSAAWCGLSWGGMVGMRLALRDPDRISALVLMDTSARPEDPFKKAKYRVMTAITRAVGPSLLLRPRVVPLFFTPETQRDRPELVDRFVDHVARMDRQSLIEAVDAVIFDREDISAEIGRIEARALVMTGEEDRATPMAEAELIAGQIEGARLVRIPRAAHLANLEQPDLVNDELSRFLA